METPLTKEEVQTMIDKTLKGSFTYRRVGDTPTDALQLTPKSYVDKSVASSGGYAGRVDSAGVAGTPFPAGWTSVRNSLGSYTVTHNLGTTAYAPVVSAVGSTAVTARVPTIANNSVQVFTTDATGSLADSAFSFIIKS